MKIERTMQQILQQLLANQEKAEANMKADLEQMEINRKADLENLKRMMEELSRANQDVLKR
jgi:hypothetical protein